MLILVNSLIKKIFTPFSLPFSTKKSQQQLSYYQHRKKSLPNFNYQHVRPTITLQHFNQKYSTSQTQPPVQIVAGRISSIRKHGKTTFIDIRQQHHRLQVALKTASQDVPFRRGDVVAARGTAFITKKGELSLLLQKQQDLWVVSPCLWMLPQYGSLKDHQLRYRNKHIDLITNQQSMRLLKLRSTIIGALRQQLLSRQYIQVQTPTLSPSCGGAIAKPFITYHNQHKMSLFLRIAPQLYLKRLLIGGLSKVFQIGKNYRNQSIDQTHNPQFSSCQLYCAYADYRDMIKLTKQLICGIVRKAMGIQRAKIMVGGKEIDLEGEWVEVDFIEGLQEKIGVKIPQNLESEQTRKFLEGLCLKHHVAIEQPKTTQRLLDKLAGHFLQPLSHQKPLLIMHHPKILSPLAKPVQGRLHLTCRFQLFIRGWQLVNSYTQLNDPQIQRANTPEDADFVQALQYGLMPCAGWGIGIDRLIMLLGECQRIQEVIIFPLLKDESG